MRMHCHAYFLRAAKVAFISAVDRKKRVNWVRKMKMFPFWNKVFVYFLGKCNATLVNPPQVAFSDEKRFLIWGDRPVRVWRREGERLHANYTRKLVRSRKGIMGWMAIKRNGQHKLLRCPETLNSGTYQRDILTPALSYLKGARATNGRVFF
jgi:hypothetical protein